MILEQRNQDRWLQTLSQVIQTRNLVEPKDRVLLCCSGGLDSSALLHMFSRLADLLDIDLQAVHVDHRTREDSSKQEGAWLQVLCDRIGIPLARLSVPTHSKLQSQMDFRQARLSLIEDYAEEHQFQKIATAHHANDNAETLLMRMMSGSGLNGLRGISPQRDKWIRPLLGFTREELQDYLQKYGLGWVEDPSNARSDYLRNKIRNDIFPIFEESRKSSIRNLSRLAERIDEEEAEWDEWIAGELAQNSKNQLAISTLEKWPRNLQRRILRTWLGSLGFENVPAWIETLLKKNDFLTPSGSFLFRSDTLIYSPEGEFGSLWSMGLGPLDNERRIDLGPSRAWSYLSGAPHTEALLKMSLSLQFRAPNFHGPGQMRLAWDSLPWPLALRNWQKFDPVDWIQKVLREKQIPKAYWAQWPALVGYEKQEFVGLLGLDVLEKYQHKGLERCVCFQPIFEEDLSRHSGS